MGTSADDGLGREWFESQRYRPSDQFLSATKAELPLVHLSIAESLALISGSPDEGGIGRYGPPVAARLNEATHDGSDSVEQFNRRYEDVFARDALIISRFCAHRYPDLERATVEFCATNQGIHFDSRNDEEPGKNFHLYRDPSSPRAKARTAKTGTTWPYYGAVDTTPTFISSALRVAKREAAKGNDWLNQIVVGRDGHEVTIASTIEHAIGWIIRRTETSPDKPFRFVDGEATRHYGSPPMWKDSAEAYHRSNGELASPMIASVEVQALAYDALLDGADAADQGQLNVDAAFLQKRAQELKEQTIAQMWLADRDTFALGCDRNDGTYRLLDVVGSNAGWLLDSRFLTAPEDRVYSKGIVRSLFAPDMMTPVGIRTLSTTSPLYRPYGYHNGSIWPHDNAIIIAGLLRHDLTREARQLSQCVNRCYRDGLYPEYVSADSTAEQTRYNDQLVVYRGRNLAGQSEDRHLIEPPQANAGWSAAAALYLGEMTLGRSI